MDAPLSRSRLRLSCELVDDDGNRHSFSTEIVPLGRDETISSADVGAACGYVLRAVSPFVTVGQADIAKTEFIDELIAAADLPWLD